MNIGITYYITVSTPATQVIARVLPIDIMTDRKNRIFRRSKANRNDVINDTFKDKTAVRTNSEH